MTQHARFAPSDAELWGNCSGSLRAREGSPNLDSDATREGTAVHWVIAEVLTSYKTAGAQALLCSDFIGKAAPNGVMIDAVMADGADTMVSDVLAVCQKHGCVQQLLVEHRVHMPHLHRDCWGTLDAAVYVPSERLIYIWDYKNGHREKRAENNSQLICYLHGLAHELGIDDQRTRVAAKIVQPFCYRPGGPVDGWTFTLSDLRASWNRLAAQAAEADSNPQLRAGAWCRDCSAVGKCSAARDAAYAVVDFVKHPYAMDSMTGRDLAAERELLKTGSSILTARLDAIEDDLKHRIAAGDSTTGLALESTPGRLNWVDTCTPAVARALFSQFGVDISVEAVLTPAQSIKKAPKEVKPMLEKVLANYASRKAGALKLVNATDTVSSRAFSTKRS